MIKQFPNEHIVRLKHFSGNFEILERNESVNKCTKLPLSLILLLKYIKHALKFCFKVSFSDKVISLSVNLIILISTRIILWYYDANFSELNENA
jgi:hypothetical protein